MNKPAPVGLLQQPKPFFMIFFVELWERFGYYGVQGILAVFFVKQLGFTGTGIYHFRGIRRFGVRADLYRWLRR